MAQAPDEVTVDIALPASTLPYAPALKSTAPFLADTADAVSTAADADETDEDDEEALQDSVFLGLASVPVKNTFVHMDVNSSLEIQKEKKWPTAPEQLLSQPFKTKQDEYDAKMAEVHAKGICKPCAYFLYKKDGCRWGRQCEFCHLCKRGEIKRRKKEKVRNLKAAEAAEVAEAVEAEAAASGGADEPAANEEK
mmetsp:Transcript_81958/g.155658  ORF Transcript_81958/g.155658 Transcript_81958/m.155658 type:complete len:195 (+) Transcript_81958:53-637(+)